MKKLGFLILSLPIATLMFPYSSGHAGLRVSNAGKTEMLRQNAARQQAAFNEPQPARVFTDDKGAPITVEPEDIEACEKIWPDGKFDWTVPTSGMKKKGPATCVAYIELKDAKTNTVLAHTYLAAGDAMKCNIDDFANITISGRGYTYPADAAPTIDDVKKVMAQENKQNAGWKILGAALVGGIGGNLIGQDDEGSDSPFGFGGNKVKTTAVGAVGAAALMTAGTQVNDYKAGSVILSTGMNATAGAMVGNLSGPDEEVIKIAPCKIRVSGHENNNDDCIYGRISVKGTNQTQVKTEGDVLYAYDMAGNRSYKCFKKKKGDDDNEPQWYWDNCSVVYLDESSIKFGSGIEGVSKLKDMPDKVAKYYIKKDKSIINFDDSVQSTDKCNTEEEHCFVKIEEAKLSGSGVIAMIPHKEKSLFGVTDWDELKKVKLKPKETETDPKNTLKMYASNGLLLCANGQAVDQPNYDANCIRPKLDDFKVSYQSSDDSDGIDFENKARMKSTLSGAGVGGVLGAISGASGAEQEINERFVAEQRNYKDSLEQVYCISGNRFTAPYNEIVVVPEMKK